MNKYFENVEVNEDETKVTISMDDYIHLITKLSVHERMIEELTSKYTHLRDEKDCEMGNWV